MTVNIGREPQIVSNMPVYNDETGEESALAALGFTWDESVQAGITVPGTSKEMRRRNVLHRYRSSIPEFVWDAAVLEGSAIVLAEVMTIAAGQRPRDLETDEILFISNLVDAHRDLEYLVRAGEFGLTKAVSDRLHRHVSSGIALESGHFRGEGALQTDVSVPLPGGGEYHPKPTIRGGRNLVDTFDIGVRHLNDHVPRHISKALAYFAFATKEQFYYDANKRTARMMMNGYLMSEGLDAITVPAAKQSEWHDGLNILHRDSDATPLFAVMTDSHPEIRYVRSGRVEEPDWGDGRTWEEVASLAAGDITEI